MQKFDHNIGFWEERQFVRRKLSKFAENCDHNIDPRFAELSPFEKQFSKRALAAWSSGNVSAEL
jgi:hypothetical protein